MKLFISCDWGTSSFRLRLIDAATQRVLTESKSMQGIAATHAAWLQANQPGRVAFYCGILQQHLGVLESECGFSLNNTTIIISGMASSQIGIFELPYLSIPFNIQKAVIATHVIPANNSFPYEIVLVSGVRSGNDVMRGEETILAGCEIKKMDSEQLYILPGTHSKHIVVQDGLITAFKTYLTGEIFNLLATKSILANSVEINRDDDNSKTFFLEGVKAALDSNILNSIFTVRTNQLFEILNKKENYQYLSGLIIGTELKDVFQTQNGTITIVSEGFLTAAYKLAFSVLSNRSEIKYLNADEALIKGHTALLLNITSN
ncbi:MAG: 2-dehydro-3-deoxygalactonokinase [Bacteroidota bacterium]